MMVLCLLITFLVFFSYYLFVLTLKVKHLSGRLVSVGILSFAQIILTQLILGISALLYLPLLIILNLSISVSILIYSLKKEKVYLKFKEELIILRDSGFLGHWENIAILLLSSFVCLWVLASTYFFSPRGVDDLGYHLPSIYEYIIKHRIFLLPTELTKSFAHPLNADFLFMWPVIFSHSQRWVDCVQLFAALFGVVTIYALLRQWQHSQRNAFFLAWLFLFTPVVLMQTGSNYNDIITNVFFLTSIYAVYGCRVCGRLPFLYLAAVSMGLLLGMKIHFLPLILWLQLFILWRLWREKRKYFIFYILIIMLCGSYWALRNFGVFHNLLYPLELFHKGFGFFQLDGSPHSSSYLSNLMNNAKLLYVDDVGLGSFNGGYGLIFWGMAFPCWFYVFLKSFVEAVRGKIFNFLFWLQIPLAIFMLLNIPSSDFIYTSRYVLFVTGLGLLAAGEVFYLLKDKKVLLSALKLLCLIFGFLSITLMSISVYPHYRLDAAVQDIKSGIKPSEFKYLRYSTWYLPDLSYIAAPLDYLSKNDTEGFICYGPVSAVLYGSNLQNRMWHIEKDHSMPPDAYILNRFDDEKKVKEIALDQRYQLVIQTPYTVLFIRKEALEKNNRKALLAEYYKQTSKTQQ